MAAGDRPWVPLDDYRPQILRHLRAMTRDAQLAEDLTQETYARAIARSDELRDSQAALAWLYRVATSVCLDTLRRRRPALVPFDDHEERSRDEHAPSALGAALERSDMSECVQRYLAELPDDYRVAMLLHDAHGFTNAEIAELVGCSLATAKIRVHRARRRLRQALDAACLFSLDERGVVVCEPGSNAAEPD